MSEANSNRLMSLVFWFGNLVLTVPCAFLFYIGVMVERELNGPIMIFFGICGLLGLRGIGRLLMYAFYILDGSDPFERRRPKLYIKI